MNIIEAEKQINGLEYFDSSENNSIPSLIDSVEMKECKGQLVVPFGIDNNGHKYYEDLAAIPHMLISGTTGSGKTAFIQSIITSLMMLYDNDEIQFVIFDTKGVDYMCFEDSKYLYYPIIKDDDDFSMILSLINLRLENGDYSRDYHRTGTKDNPAHIFVIIDDFVSINDVDTNIEILRNILRNGRSVGVHCILITSLPSADIVSPELKSNIPCRIAFRTASKQISRIIIDENGAEILVSPGEMIAKVTSRTIKCNCIYSPYEEIATFLKEEAIKKNMHTSVESLSISKFDDIYNKVIDIFTGNSKDKQSENQYTGLKESSEYDHINKEVTEEDSDYYMNLSNSEQESNNDNEKPLRPFPETSVKGGKFSVHANKIHLAKSMYVKGLPSTLTPSFGGGAIIGIVRKQPRFGKQGYFSFNFNSKANISKEGQLAPYLDVDYISVSEYCTIEFDYSEKYIVNLFLKQLSEDLKLPITNK
jgi:Cdc6-like AAA superfamily ATPase